MFCEKCGAQLPDGAKFCEKCGSSTEPGAAPAAAAAAAVTPAAPSAFSLALKKFFSNKKNVAIAAIALFLVIAAIVAIIVIASQPEKIYVDDYFHVVFKGVDGNGTVYFDISEKEANKLKKLNKKLFGDDADEESLFKYITPSFDLSAEERNALKNGDTVKIKIKINKEIYDEAEGYKFVLRNKTVKVKGLYKPTELNLLDYIKPSFGGYNGYGTPHSEQEEVFKLLNGVEARVSSNYDDIRVEFYETANDSYIMSFYADFDRYTNLSNGETVSISINASNIDTSSLYNGYGLILSSQTKEYTVSGLIEPNVFNVAEKITTGYNGLSSIAYLNLDVPTEPITVGNYKVVFTKSDTSSDYVREFYIELRNDAGDELTTLTYRANAYQNLKNGDKITVETYSSIDYIVTEYGIVFPESFEIEVAGLSEPFNANPMDRGTHSFSGYNGYGKFTFNIPEDKLVYKSDDGKYTIKLTPYIDYSYYKINVVVADETGTNFLTFNYSAYMSSYLKNGGTIDFTCSEWTTTLENYVREYGLYFPYRVVYTAEGLMETTTVKPLDKVTFTFAKSGDDIKASFSLTENVITVGDYTVNLSTESYESWGSEYAVINLDVKDKSGTEIGSGYYRIRINGLTEGSKLSAYDYISGATDIARATGIVFSDEGFAPIVSTK